MDSDIRSKTCCFTGHREIPALDKGIISLKLKKTLEDLIKNQGVIYFGVGGAVGFDMMVEKTVLKLKKKYPFIRLILVLPCKNHTKFWSREKAEKFYAIKNQADKITYASESYTPYCMHTRNRILVDNSKYCICYYKNKKGGTEYTINYAKEKALEIINLA